MFDRDSGVSLIDAVAASCAVPLVWPPMTIDGQRYIDGGVRSVANIDLAKGYERVVRHRSHDGCLASCRPTDLSSGGAGHEGALCHHQPRCGVPRGHWLQCP